MAYIVPAFFTVLSLLATASLVTLSLLGATLNALHFLLGKVLPAFADTFLFKLRWSILLNRTFVSHGRTNSCLWPEGKKAGPSSSLY